MCWQILRYSRDILDPYPQLNMNPAQDRLVEIEKGLFFPKHDPSKGSQGFQGYRRKAFAVKVTYRPIFEKNIGLAK
jgi:hypothetical protein